MPCGLPAARLHPTRLSSHQLYICLGTYIMVIIERRGVLHPVGAVHHASARLAMHACMHGSPPTPNGPYAGVRLDPSAAGRHG